jgi:phosphoenolpyruvate synthase/pyruvate phosphate dikinase
MSLELSLPNQPLPTPRARAREPFVSWFDAIGRDATPRVWGKGANLDEMMRAGLPVPFGFVVTVAAFREFLEESGVQHEIESRLRCRPSLPVVIPRLGRPALRARWSA